MFIPFTIEHITPKGRPVVESPFIVLKLCLKIERSTISCTNLEQSRFLAFFVVVLAAENIFFHNFEESCRVRQCLAGSKSGYVSVT